MKVISIITEPGVVDSILRHLHQHDAPTGRDPPTAAPPEPF